MFFTTNFHTRIGARKGLNTCDLFVIYTIVNLKFFNNGAINSPPLYKAINNECCTPNPCGVQENIIE